MEPVLGVLAFAVILALIFGIQRAMMPDTTEIDARLRQYGVQRLELDEVKARDAVSERTQAAYYRRALAAARCQPTVAGFLIFHVSDERDLKRWQSGLYYADDTPKSSLRAVRNAIASLRAGTLGRCRGS